MALPKIDVPTYDITLPVSKKQIRYRPFLVKEQRNLSLLLIYPLIYFLVFNRVPDTIKFDE